MFEKEAEEYANREVGTIQNDEWKNCVLDWQKGAEFGYNKALEETHNYIAELEKENAELKSIAQFQTTINGTRKRTLAWF